MPVSKSVWSILAIGASGLILLSVMMQQYAGELSERDRSPYAAAIEAGMGSKLVGSVRVDKLDLADEGGGFSFNISATVIAGVDKQKLAEAAGRDLWLSSMRAGERPRAVAVTIREAGVDAAGETFDVSWPRTRR